ncbi:hypothetical protein CBOM_07496 [Ceraceosorus bombacis]|uniref:Uncharacterized protein n=1 Tax=Ceraceosorus bombacis TaxID=401625 RepID=A0A0P1BDX4_9BASI|nr:hypothetical protein CBOM_07496 [Ceraceosorus bombacis]
MKVQGSGIEFEMRDCKLMRAAALLCSAPGVAHASHWSRMMRKQTPFGRVDVTEVEDVEPTDISKAVWGWNQLNLACSRSITTK